MRPAQEAQTFAQGALPLRLGERTDDVGQGGEVDRTAGLDSLDTKSQRQVGFAAPRLPNEVDDLMAVDELELGQGEDAVAVERGLEREVEAGQGLDGEQPAHLERGPDPPALAQGQFLTQQRLQRLRRADLTAFQAAQDMIEHLQRPRHLEADEVAADPVNRAGWGSSAHDDAPPSAASRRPTAS